MYLPYILEHVSPLDWSKGIDGFFPPFPPPARSRKLSTARSKAFEASNHMFLRFLVRAAFSFSARWDATLAVVLVTVTCGGGDGYVSR